MRYTSLIITSFIALLLVSCGSREASELFARVEALMDERPDSALALLDSAASEMDTYSKAQLMRYHLLHAKAQNKAYVDFTSDSIMKEVVDYYDAHGTANEKVDAHYLLGCVYRDLHESPMALSCYLDATEKADTLSDDCDYAMLMRVWGQIADEYDRQAMPYKELDANHKYQKYALLAKDTFNYIISAELDRRPYQLLNDTAMARKVMENACSLYVRYGYKEYATKMVYPLISLYVACNDMKKAAETIQYFEKESGMFDENGDIKPRHEHYYNTKALYYEKIGILDSAEYYYRKLLNHGNDFDMYRGLLSVFEKNGKTDSICKYSKLKDIAFEKQYSSLSAQAMYSTEGMFNYTRNQHIALEKEKEASRNRKYIILLGIATASLLILSLYVFINYRRKKQHEYSLLVSRYYANKEEYQKAVSDYQEMEENFEDYKRRKAEEIRLLQNRMAEFCSDSNKEGKEIVLLSIKESSELSNILRKTKVVPMSHYLNIENREWDALFLLFKKELPSFYMSVIANQTLSEQEIKVAVLTAFDVDTKTLALLLNTTSASVSNTKKNISKKLFSSESARNLYYNLIHYL